MLHLAKLHGCFTFPEKRKPLNFLLLHTRASSSLLRQAHIYTTMYLFKDQELLWREMASILSSLDLQITRWFCKVCQASFCLILFSSCVELILEFLLTILFSVRIWRRYWDDDNSLYSFYCSHMALGYNKKLLLVGFDFKKNSSDVRSR